jgi:N-acetylglucosamine malate deacetylase 1
VNVLIISPHPDDESIGCGGAATLHSSRGDRVDAVFLTSGELGLKSLPMEEARQIREAEAREATRILGIREAEFLRLPDWGCGEEIERAAALLAPRLACSPGIVYLPHPAEDHPDHRAALPIVHMALEMARVPKPELRGFEVWTPLAAFDVVEDIGAVVSTKLSAVRAHASQLHEYRYDLAVLGLNQYRGIFAGRCEFAEVYSDLNGA